jgi:hypothetical protein
MQVYHGHRSLDLSTWSSTPIVPRSRCCSNNFPDMSQDQWRESIGNRHHDCHASLRPEMSELRTPEHNRRFHLEFDAYRVSFFAQSLTLFSRDGQAIRDLCWGGSDRYQHLLEPSTSRFNASGHRGRGAYIVPPLVCRTNILPRRALRWDLCCGVGDRVMRVVLSNRDRSPTATWMAG